MKIKNINDGSFMKYDADGFLVPETQRVPVSVDLDVVDYDQVWAYDPDALVEAVKDMVKDGWQPWGTVVPMGDGRLVQFLVMTSPV